jgi:serine phosphatase RsbU (regulator of sigma subunit)/HAMP domain-containing protein
MLNSIFTKILLSTVLLIVFIALFMGIANRIWYEKTLKSEIDAKGTETLKSLSENEKFQEALRRKDEPQILELIGEKTMDTNILYLVVYTPDSLLVSSGRSSLIPTEYFEDPILYQITTPLRKTFEAETPDFRDISLPVFQTEEKKEMQTEELLFGDENLELLDEEDVIPDENDASLESDEPEVTLGYIRIGISLEDVNEKMQSNSKINWMLTIFAIALGIIFAATLSFNITSPIKKLRDATEIIASGNFDYDPKIKSKDEIGDLATSFNEMTEELEFIKELTDEFNKKMDIESLSRSLLWFIVGVLDYDRAFLFVKQDDVFRFIQATGKWSQEKLDVLKSFTGEWLSESWTTDNFLQGLLASVAQEQKPITLDEETETDMCVLPFAKMGIDFIGTPSIIRPIIVKQETVGVLCVSNSDTRVPFTKKRSRLLDSIIREAGSAIVNNQLKTMIIEQQRLKSELDIATRIQTSLLPPIPELKGYDVDAAMIPAEEVGGDYYDFIPGKDGSFWLGIGDVTSHGLTPGLIMMMAQSTLNAIIAENPKISPKRLISYLNVVLYSNIRKRLGVEEHMTISVLSGNGEGKFRYAGAHEDIIIYRYNEKKCERIETKGFWVGILPDIHPMVFEDEISLEEKDVMVLYTDGIIEAKNKLGVQFDVDRLTDTITENAHLPAADIKQAILASVQKWMAHQADDITLVVIKKDNNK